MLFWHLFYKEAITSFGDNNSSCSSPRISCLFLSDFNPFFSRQKIFPIYPFTVIKDLSILNMHLK